MGYIINPAEVRNWIWEVKSWLYEMEERYQSAFAIIKEFAENEGLEGNSYDKMKADFMIYHQLSVHGAGEVRGSIDRDLFILEGTIGEENLDEDRLLEQIENQKAICRKCEDIIDNLTSLSRVPFMEYFLESLIEKYRILLAKAEGLLEDLEEKLERIYEINDNTARLFITASDWLSAISSAIRDLQVCVTGKGNVSDGSWKDLLMPSFEEKVGKLEIFEGGSDNYNDTIDLINWMKNIEIGDITNKENIHYVIKDGKIIGINIQYANDGYITIAYGHVIQTEEDAKKYGFEIWTKKSKSEVLAEIERQINYYSDQGIENPAILSLEDAEDLLKKDIGNARETAENLCTDLSYSKNQIDAITSSVFNAGTKYKDDPDSLQYYLLNNDAEGAMNVLHKAVENDWYKDNPGLLRRRLMEYNIYFNNNYKYYSDEELKKLKEDTGF